MLPIRSSLVLVAAVCVGCANPPPTSSTSSSTGGAPVAAAAAPAGAAAADPVAQGVRLAREGALVIDVRETDEWDTGHLAQAKLVPVGAVAQRLGEINGWVGGDKTKPIVLYCRSGRRAGAAKETLTAAGYTNVINAGGYTELQAALTAAGAAP